MKESLVTINKVDQQKVYADYYAVSNPKALLVIFHGMAEHKGRYEDFARYLNQHGFNVLVCDHRGHGDSFYQGQLAGHFAHENGWFLNVEDLHNLVEQALEKSQLDTYALLGHSMGSIFARSYFKRYHDKISHLILTGVPESPVGISFMRITAKTATLFSKTRPSEILYQGSFVKFNKATPSKEPYAWLSHDQANIEAYKNDPLCGFRFTRQAFLDFLDGLEDIKHLDEIKVTLDTFIWFVVGEEDVTINVDQLQEQMRKYQELGFSQVVISMLSNAAHEVLFDVEKDELWKQIVEVLNNAGISGS